MLNRESRMNNNLVSDEEEESKSENWGFAGADDLDPIMDSYLLADTSHHNHTQTSTPGVDGILIVGGYSTEIHSEDLSLPGTESLPTDVGSLNDTAHFDSALRNPNHEQANKRTMWAMATIALLAVALLSIIGGCVCLWRDRQGLHERNQGLQLQVRELENQLETLHEDMKAGKQQRRQREAWNTRADSDWDNEDFVATNKVLLADNCWFKAELELGDCLNDVTDKFTEFSTNTFQKYFGNENDNEDALFQSSAWKAASEATNAAATAAVNVMDSMVYMGKVLDDSVLYAFELTRDAVEDATLSKHV